MSTAWVNEDTGKALTAPLAAGFTGPLAPGFDRRMLAVLVRNSGGAPTSIERVAIALSNGITFFDPEPAVGPGYPRRLESHSSETWLIEPHGIVAAAEVSGVEPIGTVSVLLGSGKTYAKDGIQLD